MDETSAIGSVISYYCIVSSFVIFGVSMWSYELETLVEAWQGRRDSNPQPTVLETVALPIAPLP